MLHTHTPQHKRQWQGTNPVFPTSSCGQVYLSGRCFGGASHGSVPRPHRVVCAKPKRKTHILTTCPPILCLWHTQVSIIRVMLGCKKILANQNNYLSMTKLHENLKIASKLPHHSPLQLQTYKYHSQRWVTSLPKGDPCSQQIIDSEATHTWEMRFHTHTQTHQFSAA